MRRRCSRWRGVTLLALVLTLAQVDSAVAYLKFGYEVNGEPRALRWRDAPVSYYISNYAIPNVPVAAFQTAVTRAFETWEAVPTATIAYRFGGYTAALPGDADGRSTLGFLNEPTLDRVLATTSYLIDSSTGELLEADIFFNSIFTWSAADGGVTNRWDLQTIAVHEIGHLNGLGHSAIGETTVSPIGRRVESSESVMFPIALPAGDISARALKADDIAGISDLYPTEEFNRVTGSVSGRVTKAGGGVLGAHVVAFDVATGEQVASFTLNTSGQFSIAGLRPGPHLLRVEPLDDADLESFLGADVPIDLRFWPMFHDRLVVVPRGGDSGAVTVVVTAR